MITADQIRMARAGVRVSVRKLAQLADVSAMTVTRLENGRSGGHGDTLRKIQLTLEKLGAEFTNGDAPGVKLRKVVTTTIGRKKKK
ncbi:MAG TPA: helix-turn-helix transcriptional regulator [Rhizomicrobium sp.]